MQFFKWFALALMVVGTTLGIVATASAQGGDVSRGSKLYVQNCAVCHGDRAQGRVGATLAKDFPGIRVDALLKETISSGVAGSVMPAWAKAKGGPLSDAEIDDVVAFILSLSRQAPTVPLTIRAPTIKAAIPSPVATFPPGNLVRGTKVYVENCMVCHGEKGEGRIGASLQKDWPGFSVEALLDATIARGVAGTKMPAWSKAYGGPLMDQEIADAAAFVRTLKKIAAQQAPTQASEPAQGSPISGTVTLVCASLIVVVGGVVLAFGLAGSRAKQQ